MVVIKWKIFAAYKTSIDYMKIIHGKEALRMFVTTFLMFFTTDLFTQFRVWWNVKLKSSVLNVIDKQQQYVGYFDIKLVGIYKKKIQNNIHEPVDKFDFYFTTIQQSRKLFTKNNICFRSIGIVRHKIERRNVCLFPNN